MEIREIKQEEEAERIYHIVHGAGTLPGFLYHEEQYHSIVLELITNQKTGGMLFGVIKKEDPCFFLHFLQVTRDTDASAIIFFLKELKNLLMESYHTNVMYTFDKTETAEVTVFQKILKRVPGYKVEKVQYIQQLGFKTKDLEQLRKFRWYCPGLLEKKGFSILAWKDIPLQYKQEIIKNEAEGSVDPDYVPPGLSEPDWTYDENTSFALVKEGGSKPIGWVITEKLSENTALLRRFYIYNEPRRLCMGPAFVTRVLDIISEYFDELHYEVVKGNRQMEMFTNHYCKPILTFNYFKCNITIDLIK